MLVEHSKESREQDDDDCLICKLMETGEGNNLQKLQEAFVEAAKNPNAVVGFGEPSLKDLIDKS